MIQKHKGGKGRGGEEKYVWGGGQSKELHAVTRCQ